MIEYLLLGGFIVAALYVVYELFVGWRRSQSAREDGSEI